MAAAGQTETRSSKSYLRIANNRNVRHERKSARQTFRSQLAFTIVGKRAAMSNTFTLQFDETHSNRAKAEPRNESRSRRAQTVEEVTTLSIRGSNELRQLRIFRYHGNYAKIISSQAFSQHTCYFEATTDFLRKMKIAKTRAQP